MPPLARAKVPSRWSGWCPLAGRMAPDLRSARMAHDVSRVDIAAGGNVVDLAARRADVHQLPVTQAGQRAAQSPAIATCLKDIPVLPDQAADMPGRYGRPFRPHCTLDQGHCGAFGGCFSPREGARRPTRVLDRQLTFFLPAAYSCDVQRAKKPTPVAPEGSPKGFAPCAISLRSMHSTPVGESCIAERIGSQLRHWCSISSIT